MQTEESNINEAALIADDAKSWIQRNVKGDRIIWGIVFLLSLVSIIVVYSATGKLAFDKYDGRTEYFLGKHTMLMVASFVVMWVAHRINYKYYSGISKIMMGASIILLLMTMFGFGVTVNGAVRWINIPILNQTFQPSDLAKLGLITFLANLLSKKQSDIADFKKSFLPMMGWTGVICGLIGYSDMSTALMLLATSMLLLIIGRVPMRYIILSFVGACLALTVALAVGQRLKTVISRIEKFGAQTFKGEEPDFQVRQGYIAIAKGGILNFDPGGSTQRNLLPNPFSDYIYAIIIEEYGMLGGIVILFLYLALLYRGMITVTRSSKAFGGLLSAGLSFLLVIQAMINMGVTVGLGPVTGLPLPLLSMGGTSLLFTGLAIGIILSVSRGDGENPETPGMGNVFKGKPEESIA